MTSKFSNLPRCIIKNAGRQNKDIFRHPEPQKIVFPMYFTQEDNKDIQSKQEAKARNLRVMTKEDLRITLGTRGARSPDWSKLRSSGGNFFMEMRIIGCLMHLNVLRRLRPLVKSTLELRIISTLIFW